MRLASVLATLSASASSVYAITEVNFAENVHNNNTLGGANVTYAPVEAYCPAVNSSAIYNRTSNDGFIRSNALISQDEFSYISAREVKATDSLIEFLDDLSIPGYNDTSFANYFDMLNQSAINVGLSFSGGGFRALFTGAGEIMALDSRTQTKNSTLKGLLDSASYISGLSGGSILLNTLVFNNWTSVEDIVYDNTTTLWNTTRPLFPTDITYWLGLIGEVNQKKAAGYDISLIDLFGRILSRYMFEEDEEKYGINTLYSDAQFSDAFLNYDMPFPIIEAAGGSAAAKNISVYSTNLFEINPFEFGSFSPFVGGFIPIDILGSALNNGLPVYKDECTYDFDNVGFLTAASSNILVGFQSILAEFLSGDPKTTAEASEALGTNISGAYLETLISLVNGNLNETLFALLDNPFYNSTLAYEESDLTEGEMLKLVDGGAFTEAIPLEPMLVPSRLVDVVFAFDNSAATNDSWPNGDSLFATEERWLESFPEDSFYELPESTEQFVELGLNKKPVFFGCNGTNLITDQNNPNATVEFNYMKPLIVYVPNTNLTTMSNITNYQFSYEERNALVENGFEVAMGDDDDFAQCVGCAIIRRSEERSGIELSPFCSQCFSKYCFEPTYESASNATIKSNVTMEAVPTTIYSSSALPSGYASLTKRFTSSAAFPTSFSKSAY